jgi:hypothetical protein
LAHAGEAVERENAPNGLQLLPASGRHKTPTRDLYGVNQDLESRFSGVSLGCSRHFTLIQNGCKAYQRIAANVEKKRYLDVRGRFKKK